MERLQNYSLIETVKANDQPPYAWLHHAPERLRLRLRLQQTSTVEDFEALRQRKRGAGNADTLVFLGRLT